MGKVAAYCRLPVEGVGWSPVALLRDQLSAIAVEARKRGDTVELRYSDRSDRGGYEQLLQDAAAGKVAKVYLLSLSALHHGTVDAVLLALEELHRLGIAVESIEDGLSIDAGASGKQLLSAMQAVNKMDRERLPAAGTPVRRWGRPRSMTARQVKKVNDMYRDGRSVRWIAQKLGKPRTTIRRYITVPVITRGGRQSRR